MQVLVVQAIESTPSKHEETGRCVEYNVDRHLRSRRSQALHFMRLALLTHAHIRLNKI